MEKEGIRSGDFLKDVDIMITLRSGSTDLKDLQKLIQALSASVNALVDTRIVTTETEMKVKQTSQGKLTSLTHQFYIK